MYNDMPRKTTAIPSIISIPPITALIADCKIQEPLIYKNIPENKIKAIFIKWRIPILDIPDTTYGNIPTN